LKRFLISFVITLVLLFILFTQISLGDLLALFLQIDPLWATLGFAAYFLTTLFRALRFRWLIHSKEISLDELLRISIFYHLSLMVLPSKLGELSYPYLLNRVGGISMTEGLASLISARIYDFFIVLVIFLFSSLAFQSLFKVGLLFILILTLLLILVILLVFFHMNHLLSLISRVWRRILKIIRKEESKPSLWVQRKIHEMSEDFYAIRAKKTYLAVALTSLLSWFMIFLTFQAFLLGFGVNISFIKMVFGSTVAVIANALPIGGIGNWGTLEIGWAAGFLMAGLSKEQAIVTGFGVHILIFICCALLGLLGWVTIRKKKAPLPAS
jgi:glycosyltransferase 2 family protein